MQRATSVTERDLLDGASGSSRLEALQDGLKRRLWAAPTRVSEPPREPPAMATSSIKSSDFRQKVGGQWTLDTDMQVGFPLRLPALHLPPPNR